MAELRPAPALAGLAAATSLFHVATSAGYGIFRDELYYVACGRHLALGYVDHPPLIALLAAAVRATLGDSLLALRLLPALAAGATVWLCGATAAALGGRRYAQLCAGTCAALAPIYLGLFSLFSMNAFDVVFWAAAFWLLARLLGGEARLGSWLALGVVLGLGLENKISVLFLGFGVAVGLVATRRRDLLRARGPWLAAAIALALFVPHLAWQAAHGFPTLEFMDNARRFKMSRLSPVGFLAEHVLEAGPGALPVWLAGLVWLLRSRDQRPLGIAYLSVLALLAVTHGKPYYLAPACTLLFAAGGVAVEARAGRALRALAIALVLLAGALAAPMAKPLLPVEAFVRYQAWLGIRVEAGERHQAGRLPQVFADMRGWRELAADVAGVYHALPDADRARACVFGQNYGEAGAIDFFRGALDLPPAISAHNSYWLWGPGRCTGDPLIVLGDRRERLEELFEHVTLGAVHRCADCMPYEDQLPIWVARRPRRSLSELWPAIKRFI